MKVTEPISVLSKDVKYICNPKPYQVSQIIDGMVIKLDTNPKYQRGLVWDRRMKIEFVRSLVSDSTISPITIVRKNVDCDDFWVVDGRQRVEGGILSFVEDQFKIPLRISTSEVKYLSYTEIQAKAQRGDEQCKRFISKFLTKTLQFDVYDQMPFDDQVRLFKRINQSKKLTETEKILCEYYVVKSLTEFISKEYIIKHLKKFLGDHEQCNYAMKTSRLALELLKQHYDVNLVIDNTNPFVPRDSTVTIIQDYVVRISEFLTLQKHFDPNTIINDDLLEDSGISDLKIIDQAAEYLSLVLKVQPRIRYNKSTIFDFLSFFTSMVKSKTFTYPFCEKNCKEMYALLEQYRNDRENGKIPNLKSGASQNSNRITPRYDHLLRLFNTSGLDMGKKTPVISKSQKEKAILTSNGICPISGVPLGEEIEYDHIISKQLSSKGDVQLTTPSANRVKGTV